MSIRLCPNCNRVGHIALRQFVFKFTFQRSKKRFRELVAPLPCCLLTTQCHQISAFSLLALPRWRFITTSDSLALNLVLFLLRLTGQGSAGPSWLHPYQLTWLLQMRLDRLVVTIDVYSAYCMRQLLLGPFQHSSLHGPSQYNSSSGILHLAS
jgi:hypothetical protein